MMNLLSKKHFAVCNILQENFQQNEVLKDFLSEGLDAIYCSAVYHLLCEADTRKLTRAISGLLPSGGFFFERTGGSKDPLKSIIDTSEGRSQFLHSVVTFKIMLEDSGFTDCYVLPFPRGGGNDTRNHLVWTALKKRRG